MRYPNLKYEVLLPNGEAFPMGSFLLLALQQPAWSQDEAMAAAWARLRPALTAAGPEIDDADFARVCNVMRGLNLDGPAALALQELRIKFCVYTPATRPRNENAEAAQTNGSCTDVL